MENLPLSNYRNYQSLINLVPGATPARFQNAVTDTPGRALTTNVNGQERGANNTRVDGSADILVTMPHHAVYVAAGREHPGSEHLHQQLRCRAGHDRRRGRHRDHQVRDQRRFAAAPSRCTTTARCARSPGTRIAPGSPNKPKGNRNIDGGSLGGPIKKNKLFFFANWEGTFERVSSSRALLCADRGLPQPAISAACSARRS